MPSSIRSSTRKYLALGVSRLPKAIQKKEGNKYPILIPILLLLPLEEKLCLLETGPKYRDYILIKARVTNIVLIDIKTPTTSAILNIGAIALFVNSNFLRAYKIKKVFDLITPRLLRLVDSSKKSITQIAKLRVNIRDYINEDYYYITPLSLFDIILGILQIRGYNLYITFASNSINFNSTQYCTNYNLSS